MTTDVIPVLRTTDAAVSVEWYRQWGFDVNFEHRFEEGFPAYVGIRRDGAQIHLSEHAGDAGLHTLVYVWVDDLDPIAAHFGVEVGEQPWARDIEVVDPDGNRIRIAEPIRPAGVDTTLGDGVEAHLRELETAMWTVETRGDPTWFEAHLSPDFTEHGRSGRAYDRAQMLAVPVDSIEVELPLSDVVVRPVGRDAALVTSRTVQPAGVARRASLWQRLDGRWRLTFHSATPTDRASSG